MIKFRTAAVFPLLLFLSACGGGGGNAADVGGEPLFSYSYTIPPSNGDGWAVGHLDDHNFDSALIIAMMDRIHDASFPGIDSMAIVRNDTLVLSEQLRHELDRFDPWGNNSDVEKHVLHSTSKSVTSALIGIAIDQGYVADTDVLFYDLFSYGSYDFWDGRKASMTLADALTMRLGLQWDEWTEPYGTPNNSLTILTENNNDLAKALLDLPMINDPGTDYVYNTAASIALGQALENAVGVPMEDFAETHLFLPLQITTASWGMTGNNLPNGGSGLFLKTRDMVKFGLLFINNGVWQGQQLISAAWVARSVEPHVSLNWSFTAGYGYQWWIDDFVVAGERIRSYSTRGYGGQYIFCVPDRQLVVAFTGHNYGEPESGQVFDLMRDYILPSAR